MQMGVVRKNTKSGKFQMEATALTKTIAVYCRKSRLSDDNAMELEKQEELCIDYATKNGFNYELFSEEWSSEDWNRPELTKMISEINKGKFHGVLVTDIDRLTRNRTDLGLFARETLVPNGIYFFTLNKTYNPFDNDDMFLLGLRSQMDEYLITITKEKLLRGRIQSLSQGNWFGLPPYGYVRNPNTKKLEPCPNNAHVVSELFALYVNEGYNQAEICRLFNSKGYKTTNGAKFTTRTTSYLLSNVVYTGVIDFKIESKDIHILVEDVHEPLVDKVIFQTAQTKINNLKVPHQALQRGVYSTSGLLTCKKCGQVLSYNPKYVTKHDELHKLKENRKIYALNCWSSKSQMQKGLWTEQQGKDRCSCRPTSLERIESSLFSCIRNQIKTTENQIESMLKDVDGVIGKVEQKKEALQQQLDKLTQERKRIQQLTLKGLYDEEEGIAEVQAIKHNIVDVERMIEQLDGASVSGEVTKKELFKQRLEALLKYEKCNNEESQKLNRLLKQVINKVYYYKEKVDVPNNPAPIEMIVEWKE